MKLEACNPLEPMHISVPLVLLCTPFMVLDWMLKAKFRLEVDSIACRLNNAPSPPCIDDKVESLSRIISVTSFDLVNFK